MKLHQVTLAPLKQRHLPLVKVQQLSGFLAFDLCLHNIPVFIKNIPPCRRILAGKQSAHDSGQLTPSP